MWLPLLTQLERTISKQDAEVRHVKEKLTSHDAAAKRAVATLQDQLKLRVDQVSGRSRHHLMAGHNLISFKLNRSQFDIIARVSNCDLISYVSHNLSSLQCL